MAISGPQATGHSFEVHSRERAGRDPAFAGYLLAEALGCVLGNELAVPKGLVREVIKGSLGYAELGRRTGIPEKSLVRMFGPSGNPTAAKLARVLAELQRYAGVRLTVQAEPLRKRRAAKARRRAG